jgi:hypothetical protein
MTTQTKNPKRYIGNRGIAEICNIDQATVRSYRRYNKLPEPEVWVDGHPGWTVDTIEQWQAGRPRPNQRPYTKTPRPVAS